jgi:hypothetical protein
MREMPGFLNTGASLASDLTLTLYLFLLLPGMLLGFYFARRKKYSPHHKLTMTTVVIVNWILIALVMVVGYREGVLPFLNRDVAAQFAGDPRIVLPTLHGITGGVAQLLATYLAFRMWFENVLPSWIMVKRIKRYMRFTLALWIVTIALGAIIYVSWYINPLQARAAAPVATLEPASTPEIGGTLEVMPGTTPELAPGATPELMLTAPAPGSTPEIALTPEVMFTPEVDWDDAMDATEDAIDDAMDATEDAIDDAEDAARDSARGTEEAAEEAAEATEDARDRND